MELYGLGWRNGTVGRYMDSYGVSGFLEHWGWNTLESAYYWMDPSISLPSHDRDECHILLRLSMCKTVEILSI
jgi:hypothetical protein